MSAGWITSAAFPPDISEVQEYHTIGSTLLYTSKHGDPVLSDKQPEDLEKNEEEAEKKKMKQTLQKHLVVLLPSMI
ncbi:unnamed protein product [Acanthoscelides obtectus]|uniref:Uncharacterized protein n=1 Tax=Acanthoscelides obtectus TaxID=200917 RepID=A0A9P0JUY3_ACAOB|nr:unnamed protein product [Acanthoscelides obtectus]CAK1648981.1 hypothetical protein AOBTE_LOCUS15982 [Acanthoscelides obtectus]